MASSRGHDGTHPSAELGCTGVIQSERHEAHGLCGVLGLQGGCGRGLNEAKELIGGEVVGSHPRGEGRVEDGVADWVGKHVRDSALVRGEDNKTALAAERGDDVIFMLTLRLSLRREAG